MDYFLSLFAPANLGTNGLSTQNFSSHIRKSFDYAPDSKTLVICLPGWGQKLRGLGILNRSMRNSGKSFLAYEFPRAVLSDQKETTKKLFEVIAATVRSDITALRTEYGFEKCVLVGVSLGCAMGAMVYNKNADIDEALLIVPGENVARDLWHGCRTQHLRRSYVRQKVSLDELERIWHDLAPEHNFPATNTSIHLYFGKADKVIPFKLSQTLYRTLLVKGVSVTKVNFPFGHYSVATYFLLFPGRFLNQ